MPAEQPQQPQEPEPMAQRGTFRDGASPDGPQLERRAAVHRALGDRRRLRIVDALRLSDRTPTELRAMTGLASNLLAFHLGALEEVGVVERTRSQGDGRRRYVRLHTELLGTLWPAPALHASHVLFVCTHNAARSQLAAALWHQATGRPAASAGSAPADEVHPLTVATARRHGLQIGGPPHGYDEVAHAPDLVVSVCDRAHEAGPPFDAPTLHWSVPDPIAGGPGQFEQTYALLAARVEVLADRARAA